MSRLKNRILDVDLEDLGHVVFGISVAALVVTTWVDATFWWALVPAVIGLLVAEWE